MKVFLAFFFFSGMMMTEVLHMSCFYPLKAWPVGLTDSGKTAYKITSRNVIDVAEKIGDPIDVPCGKCSGCRLAKSREWADRCVLEAKYHPFNWFITLTYDDEHVPTVAFFDDEDSVRCHHSLCKRDLQLFLKRLREKFGYESFRYYACGEYGTNTFRPHYHLLLFSQIPDRDLELETISMRNGNSLYSSEPIASVWQNGNVAVAHMSWETAAYTARYCMKKLGGSYAEVYDYLNIEPEFSVMSRRPGIGYQFYQDHKDRIYEFDHFSVSTENGGRRMRPSSYYDRLYDLENPDDLKKLKLKRAESAKSSMESKLERTDLTYDEYLVVEEMSLNDRLKKLIREEI